MVRSADAIDGLGILGIARSGPLIVPTPNLLVPEGHEPPPGIPTLRLATRPPSASGRRAYALGPAGGEWNIEIQIPTPDLVSAGNEIQLVGAAAFVRGPLGPAAAERLTDAKPDLIVLTNARALFLSGAPFVEAIGTIRRAAGAAPLLWAPRVLTPNRLPFLLYLGIDLLDATESLVDAAEGRRADPELGFVEGGRRGFCNCVGCQEPGTRVAPEHALSLIATELRRGIAALREGRLRELVESRLPSEPRLGELLRYTDRLLFDLFEERTPVVEEGIRPYVLRESFQRPNVRRFRERFLQRYQPPPSKGVLLLVPCSKTKPYRNSRSHRRFASAWEELRGPERIHVVSITSPLGVVPRELEDVAPAKHYDIPVTGDWDEAERSAVGEGIRSLLDRGSYRNVLVHLDPSEYGFVKPFLAGPLPVRWTLSDDRTTSPEPIAALREALAEVLEALPNSPGALRTVREEMRAIGRFQFGSEGAEALLKEPLRLHGRPWFQRLSDGSGTDLATWREQRGLFQLTVAGGERLGPVSGMAVEVADGVDLRGDLFSPGVLRADPGIRAGDAVVLFRHGELLGVGEAALPGRLMGSLGRGLAVAVRHRRIERASPATPKDPPE
jgi:archaeosine synthase